MPPGTRYATLGTPMGIILISFLIDDRLDPLFLRPVTPFGAGDTMPFFGTNVDTYADVPDRAEKAAVRPQRRVRLNMMVVLIDGGC